MCFPYPLPQGRRRPLLRATRIIHGFVTRRDVYNKKKVTQKSFGGDGVVDIWPVPRDVKVVAIGQETWYGYIFNRSKPSDDL